MKPPVYAIAFMALLLAYCCQRDAGASESLEARVHRVLAGMPRSKWDADEPPTAQSERIRKASRTIATASSTATDAAILLALGWHESAFAGYVARGCLPVPKGAPDCDQGRARSYWQAWAVACPRAWRLPLGSDEALQAFAGCALRRYHSAARRCKGRHPAGYWAGGFSGYRSASCSWRPAAARARTLAVKLAQLR